MRERERDIEKKIKGREGGWKRGISPRDLEAKNDNFLTLILKMPQMERNIVKQRPITWFCFH